MRTKYCLVIVAVLVLRKSGINTIFWCVEYCIDKTPGQFYQLLRALVDIEVLQINS